MHAKHHLLTAYLTLGLRSTWHCVPSSSIYYDILALRFSNARRRIAFTPFSGTNYIESHRTDSSRWTRPNHSYNWTPQKKTAELCTSPHNKLNFTSAASIDEIHQYSLFVMCPGQNAPITVGKSLDGASTKKKAFHLRKISPKLSSWRFCPTCCKPQGKLPKLIHQQLDFGRRTRLYCKKLWYPFKPSSVGLRCQTECHDSCKRTNPTRGMRIPHWRNSRTPKWWKWFRIEQRTWEQDKVIADDENELVKKYIQKAELRSGWKSRAQETRMKRAQCIPLFLPWFWWCSEYASLQQSLTLLYLLIKKRFMETYLLDVEWICRSHNLENTSRIENPVLHWQALE